MKAFTSHTVGTRAPRFIIFTRAARYGAKKKNPIPIQLFCQGLSEGDHFHITVFIFSIKAIQIMVM